MKRKEQLLRHYINFLQEGVLSVFNESEDSINVNEFKKSLDFSEPVHRLKTKIDSFYKNFIVERLDKKYQEIKTNPFFLFNDYSLFDLEYELGYTALEMNNFRVQLASVHDSLINEKLTIEDCKNIVLDFYTDLLKDDKDVEIIKKIMDRVVIDDSINRSYTSVVTKEVKVRHSDEYSFLITMAHEIAHAYAIEKGSTGLKDLRLIEMDSICIEVLLLRYLIDNEVKVLAGDKTLSEKDIDDYFASIYTMFIIQSKNIVDEMLYTYIIDKNKKDKIDLDVFEEILLEEPYSFHYLASAYNINQFLERYHNYNEKDVAIETFNNNVSYLCSGLFAIYFYEILDNPEEKEKFVEYLNHNDEYCFKEFIELFGLPGEKFNLLLSVIVTDFDSIINTDDDKRYCISDSYREIIDDEMEEYVKLVDNEISSDGTNSKIFILKKVIDRIVGKEHVDLNIYPFDVEYQLEDEEIEQFNNVKNKILELSKKNNNSDL